MKKLFFLAMTALCMLACNSNEPSAFTPAAFSVGNGKQVYFSQGNLQYQASTDTWCFAEHQYDILGFDNVTGGTVYTNEYGDSYKEGESLADKIDLFGWGTGNNPTNASYDNIDYATFTDWGVNPISNGGNKANKWRTLTKDEWDYLLEERPDAESKYGLAQVNGVNGLILLPDNWTLPSGCTFVDAFTGFNLYPEQEYNAMVNSYTASKWKKMESASAVFLPVAGVREDTSLELVGTCGSYWFATPGSEDCAFSLDISSSGMRRYCNNRLIGQSVRLVQDVQ